MKLLLMQRSFLFVTAGFSSCLPCLDGFSRRGLAAAEEGLKILGNCPSFPIPLFVLTEILLGLG